MIGAHLFDAYIRDGVTGEPRPLPRIEIAPHPAIYVNSGAEHENSPVPFDHYPDAVFLELTHRTNQGEMLPDGIEGRVIDRKDDMVKVWFQERGVYIVHADSARGLEDWGRA